MKKAISIILALTLALVMSAGCSTGGSEASTVPSDSTAPESSSTDANPADDWPSKAINMIIPAQPGGDTDFNGRAYAAYLEDVLGVPVVVTNVDGASHVGLSSGL